MKKGLLTIMFIVFNNVFCMQQQQSDEIPAPGNGQASVPVKIQDKKSEQLDSPNASPKQLDSPSSVSPTKVKSPTLERVKRQLAQQEQDPDLLIMEKYARLVCAKGQ